MHADGLFFSECVPFSNTALAPKLSNFAIENSVVCAIGDTAGQLFRHELLQLGEFWDLSFYRIVDFDTTNFFKESLLTRLSIIFIAVTPLQMNWKSSPF